MCVREYVYVRVGACVCMGCISLSPNRGKKILGAMQGTSCMSYFAPFQGWPTPGKSFGYEPLRPNRIRINFDD